MIEADEKRVQQTSHQAQSHDNIQNREEFVHKLKKLEDFGNFSAETTKVITAMFSQLQLCNDDLAKLTGHMATLGKTLTLAQFAYIMKHSLHPLVQLSIPLHLCSPADLKFKKMTLTLAETREERAVNLMLPRPYHPDLTSLPSKHATQALAAAIHTVLQKHAFDSHESQNTICEQFQIAPKKLYEALTGKCYDTSVKLTKAEKAK